MSEAIIRGYRDEDYEQVKDLYRQSDLYGGQFDEARDGREMMAAEVDHDPEAILVYEDDMAITGTVSLIITHRMATLFRFAVQDHDMEVARALYEKSTSILLDRGYSQVQVYSPFGDPLLGPRYEQLGMNRGGTYTCFWQNLGSE